MQRLAKWINVNEETVENSLSEPQIASTASSFGDGKPEINR